MANYQAAVSGQPYRNKGGSILKAGNIASTNPITQNFTLLEATARPISYGSKVSLSSGSTGSSGNVGTYNAKTTFAYEEVAGRYIMKKYTHYVNGVADTSMNSCASSSSERMRSIPYLETTRTLGSGVTASFNPFTGVYTKGGNYGGLTTFINPIGGGTAADGAARPTDAIPGELAYKTGAKLPVTDDYQPKTAP